MVWTLNVEVVCDFCKQLFYVQIGVANKSNIMPEAQSAIILNDQASKITRINPWDIHGMLLKLQSIKMSGMTWHLSLLCILYPFHVSVVFKWRKWPSVVWKTSKSLLKHGCMSPDVCENLNSSCSGIKSTGEALYTPTIADKLNISNQ